MEPKDLTQSRRDLITQLLAAHGYKNTLDSLTGHAFKDGHIISLAHDPTALDLLPYVPIIQEELNFQRRMKFISIDGGPPVRRDTPAHANDHGDPPPELPPELLQILEEITRGRPTAPRMKTQPRPHAQNRTQGQLFED